VISSAVMPAARQSRTTLTRTAHGHANQLAHLPVLLDSPGQPAWKWLGLVPAYKSDILTVRCGAGRSADCKRRTIRRCCFTSPTPAGIPAGPSARPRPGYC